MTSLRKKILEGSTLTRKKRFKDVMTFHSEKKNKKGQTYILFFFLLVWPPIPIIVVGWRMIRSVLESTDPGASGGEPSFEIFNLL